MQPRETTVKQHKRSVNLRGSKNQADVEQARSQENPRYCIVIIVPYVCEVGAAVGGRHRRKGCIELRWSEKECTSQGRTSVGSVCCS